MPVFNQISGSWNLATIGSDGNRKAIIAESVSTDYSLAMSPVPSLAGSGETMVKKMDNIDASVSISGPFLFCETGALDGSNVTTAPEQIPCYDTYGFIKNFIAPTIKNDNLQNKFWGLKNMNMKFGSNGASVDASWWMDPEIAGIDPAIPWITSGTGIITPLRTANWYDFYFYYYDNDNNTSGAALIQDFNIDIEYSYDTWNPLGGAAVIASEITGLALNESNFATTWNHTTVRILKSINIKFNINGVIRRDFVRPPWGSTYIGANDNAPSVWLSHQVVCTNSYANQIYDVYTYCGNTGVINDFLTSLSNFREIGAYITSAKSTIKPGIMTSSVSGEYIIPIYGSI